jgi:hypothetical protein
MIVIDHVKKLSATALRGSLRWSVEKLWKSRDADGHLGFAWPEPSDLKLPLPNLSPFDTLVVGKATVASAK